MPRLFESPFLRKDITDAISFTREHWGEKKVDDYKELIEAAKNTLAKTPQIGRLREDIHPQARVLQISQPGKGAAHVILYVVTEEDEVILVRFLNERVDLPRHFPAKPESGAKPLR